MGSWLSLLSSRTYSHVLVLHAVIHGHGRGRRCTCMDVRKCKTPLPGEPAGCDKSQCSPFTNKDPSHVVSPTLCHRPPYHSVLSPLLFLKGSKMSYLKLTTGRLPSLSGAVSYGRTDRSTEAAEWQSQMRYPRSWMPSVSRLKVPVSERCALPCRQSGHSPSSSSRLVMQREARGLNGYSSHYRT
ncbi:hypothetical protein HDV57DRAFT_30351 [Trichoderma longibrachiatum]|uniref:Uncharacterized protein n=1 Tax=Trichoderma longibrachiatum ATCC 18648 TaxID=983965 RepID=A0A2T4CI33_TRILO|nr:hypothetical protein M440DRAFT_1010306 [Trichoderma longibrachiatum ATCC 18648]